MKRFSFNSALHSIAIVLAIHFGVSASARTISLEEAISKAQRFLFLNSKGLGLQVRGTTPTFKLAYEARTTDKSASCYYVLNHTSPKGYIIVSADDRLPDVLGYSNSGEFDINEVPDNMKWWWSEFERQIEQILTSANSNIITTTEMEHRAGWTEIQPLIKTQWNQYA